MPQVREQDGATMKTTRTNMQQAHFWIGKAGYAELSKMAKAQDTTVSHLLRRYANEGVRRDKFRASGGEIIYRKDGQERRLPPL